MQKPNPENRPATTAYKLENPEELALNLLKLFEQGGKVMARFVERADSQVGPYSATNEMMEAAKTLGQVAQFWFSDPGRLAEAQGELVRGYFDLWQSAVRRALGEKADPVAEPERGDNRFKDPEWSQSPYFDYWKQVYLLTARWAESILEKTDGIDERTRESRVLPRAAAQCAVAFKLSRYEPGDLARNSGHERPQSRSGPRPSGRGHGEIGRSL